jgi:hypothetical protein
MHDQTPAIGQPEVEVKYSVLVDDVEVGFGTSGAWDYLDRAIHAAVTDLELRSWERTADMPNPQDIEVLRG